MRAERDEELCEAWREGYAAAVELVRIGSQFATAGRGVALKGMAVTLESSRDEMEASYAKRLARAPRPEATR